MSAQAQTFCLAVCQAYEHRLSAQPCARYEYIRIPIIQDVTARSDVCKQVHVKTKLGNPVKVIALYPLRIKLMHDRSPIQARSFLFHLRRPFAAGPRPHCATQVVAQNSTRRLNVKLVVELEPELESSALREILKPLCPSEVLLDRIQDPADERGVQMYIVKTPLNICSSDLIRPERTISGL